MKKRIKKSILTVCMIASVLGIGIAASAATQYPTYNDVWKYGNKKISGTKYKYSDYVNFNGYDWYTASVGDKKGKRLARDVEYSGTYSAYAQYSTKKGAKTVFYNYGNGSLTP